MGEHEALERCLALLEERLAQFRSLSTSDDVDDSGSAARVARYETAIAVLKELKADLR